MNVKKIKGYAFITEFEQEMVNELCEFIEEARSVMEWAANQYCYICCTNGQHEIGVICSHIIARAWIKKYG